MLSTDLLCHRPDLAPRVASWLLSEWPGWYGPGGPGDVAADVAAFSAAADVLPVGIVVLSDGEPVGFGALKAASTPGQGDRSPWASAGYVLPSRRGQGIGAVLLSALVAHAKTLGFAAVYCGTHTAAGLLQRAGWRLEETVVHGGQPLGVYRREV